MTGETERDISGWTVDTYRVHNEALRLSEEKFQHERDRRYAEVATEREKALEIEKTARAEALQLAREIQTYKDEKANELREQLGRERLEYASKTDLEAAVSRLEEIIRPLVEFVAAQRGKDTGTDKTWGYIFATLGAAFGLFGVLVAAFVLIRNPAPQPLPVPAPQVIYVPSQSPSQSVTTERSASQTERSIK
jgi:hypothetical protein